VIYRFEDYSLDIDRRELRCGPQLVTVEPQVFDLLCFLIEKREHVVSRDDLIASVWGGRIVSESTISSRINAARYAIGDSGATQRLIRTFPRKGFRFIGEAREGQPKRKPDRPSKESSETSANADNRARRLPSSEKPSIAVLSFTNLSGDPEQDYFAEGIAEDIINELSRFSSIFVLARNSSFQYRRKPLDRKGIGRELDANYIVEGSVRRLGPQIRVSVRLIDAATDRHVWTERYDCRIEELFSVQDEIVRAVVTSSEQRIADKEAELVARRPPDSWVAYDFYLQARHDLADFESYTKAEAPLLRALEADPRFAEAYAMLTHVEMAKYWKDGDTSHIDKAHEYARRSLSLDANQSAGHNAMSLVCAFHDRMDRALTHVNSALTLNPNNTMAAVNRAQWLAFSGECSNAIEELEILLKRDPIPPSWYWDTKGSILFQLKRYQDAIDAYSMVIDRQPWQLAYTAASLAYLERIEEARLQVDSLLSSHPAMNVSKMMKIERWQTPEARDHLVQGLKLAGLPG
jgi:TolB-like protein/tetratricopeptide (TPR) repeat protein